MTKPILCIDFDGVIHSYTSPWKDAATISDSIVPGFFEWAQEAHQIFRLVVYSSRSKEQSGIIAMRKYLLEKFIVWCDNQKLTPYADAEVDELDNIKLKAEGGPPFILYFAHEKPAAFLTIDDRAICFEGDWSKLEPQELRNFKPWNKRGV